MLRTVRVHHSDAYRKIVEVQIDVAAPFTLDQMRACHNVRLAEAKAVKPGEMGITEYHGFTPDMLKLFEAWNPKVGWDGCYRLPEQLDWVDAPALPVVPVGDQIASLEAKLAELRKQKGTEDAQKVHNETEAAKRAQEEAARVAEEADKLEAAAKAAEAEKKAADDALKAEEKRLAKEQAKAGAKAGAGGGTGEK